MPFKAFGVVVHVAFLVFREETPMLLLMKNMLENGLVISIQARYVRLGSRRRPLAVENYFLIHSWPLDDI